MPVARGGGRHLARVVGLHAADRDERVAALRERVGDEVLELAGLVAAVGQAAVAVVALGPELRAAEVRGQPLEPVDRRRPEEQRVARERVEVHRQPPPRSYAPGRIGGAGAIEQPGARRGAPTGSRAGAPQALSPG